MPYTVAIIEDQRMFRELLETLVHRIPEMKVIGKACDAESGWSLLEQHTPDLALIDLGLPDESGIELAKRLTQQCPKTRLLAVTSLIDPVTTTKVYESGFSGYVEKDQSPDILIEAVLTVVEGGHYFTQLVCENRKRILHDPDALNKTLSPREQQIVGLVAQHLSNKQIAAKTNLSARTIESHRYRITKKLSLENSEQLIDFAKRLGLDKLIQ